MEKLKANQSQKKPKMFSVKPMNSEYLKDIHAKVPLMRKELEQWLGMMSNDNLKIKRAIMDKTEVGINAQSMNPNVVGETIANEIKAWINDVETIADMDRALSKPMKVDGSRLNWSVGELGSRWCDIVINRRITRVSFSSRKFDTMPKNCDKDYSIMLDASDSNVMTDEEIKEFNFIPKVVEKTLVFCLPVEGSPYLYKSLDVEDGTEAIVKTVQEAIEGRFEKLSLNMIKTMDVVIHPMFKMENHKWGFAEQLLFNKTAVVYISEENDRCGNMATIIKNKRYQVGGCPHLNGHIIIRISETEYKKICVKPLEYWANEEESDDEESDEEEEEREERKITGDCCLCAGKYLFYGNNPYPLADKGFCCNDCNDKVIDARMGFKFSEVPIIDKSNYHSYGKVISRNGNRFECDRVGEDENIIYYVSYNDDGSYKSYTYEWEGNMFPSRGKGAKVIRKIDDDDGFTYIKVVGKDYELVGDEAVVCDYDREWS